LRRRSQFLRVASISIPSAVAMPIRLYKRTDERTGIFGRCTVKPEEDDLERRFAGSPYRASARYAPGIRPGTIGPGPKDIVAATAQCFDDWLRKVLVSEQAHLRWNRIGLVFVGQVAGVR
jgi:hypothetical protein